MGKTRSRMLRILAVAVLAMFLSPIVAPSTAEAKKRCYLKKVCKWTGKKKRRCFRVRVKKCKYKHGRRKCKYKWKKRCYKVRKRKCKYKRVCYRR